jgi:gluconate 2-dehydrogenase gamma chain
MSRTSQGWPLPRESRAGGPADPPASSQTPSSAPPTRLDFLSISGRAAGGGWLALHLPVLSALSACAREDALNGEPLRLLSTAEARTLDAAAARLIPSLDGIGAREAGAVHFADQGARRVLQRRRGVLPGRPRRPGGGRVRDLDEEAQIEYLEGIEDTPFFGFLRALTVFGTFSDPRHGGGRNDAIHRIYGIEHQPGWEPPFGWYDAEVAE